MTDIHGFSRRISFSSRASSSARVGCGIGRGALASVLIKAS